MLITYFDTLYERDSTMYVYAGDIEFDNGDIVFASMGHRYRISTKYVKKIERVDN